MVAISIESFFYCDNFRIMLNDILCERYFRGTCSVMQWKYNLVKHFLSKGKKLSKIILFDSIMFVSEDKVVFAVPMTILKKYFRVVVVKGIMYFKYKIWSSFFSPWHGWRWHKSTLKNILWHFKFKTNVNNKIWFHTDLGTQACKEGKKTSSAVKNV